MAKTLQDVLDAVRAENTRVASVLALIAGLRQQLKDAIAAAGDGAEAQAKIDEIMDSLSKEAGALDMALTTTAAGEPARAGNGADTGPLPDVGAQPPSDAPGAPADPAATEQPQA